MGIKIFSKVVFIFVCLMLYTTASYAEKVCPIDGEMYPDSANFCGKHGVKLVPRKPAAPPKAADTKQSGTKPTPKSTLKIYVYYDDNKKDVFDFSGFNTNCDGYGKNGIKYEEQGVSITIPWNDVNFIFPEYGIAVLKNGHLIESKVLKPGNCSGAAIGEMRKKKVIVAGYETAKEEEIRIALSEMEVIAFDGKSLEVGKEVKRQAEEEEQRRVAEEKRQEEEQRRIAEEKRQAEELRRRQEEEQLRIAEQKRQDEEIARAKAKAEAEAAAKEIARDGRFIAYRDGTVLDTTTNLMWAARDNGSKINWADAKSYCENYRGGGYTDWRMPTQNELASLYNKNKSYQSECRGPAGGTWDLHLTELIRLTCTWVWASETRGSSAANFLFPSGRRNWYLHNGGNANGRALPVRFGN